MPIPELDDEQKEPFIKLAEETMQAKKEGRDTADLEMQIDTTVYELFDLAPDEIALIEQKA